MCINVFLTNQVDKTWSLLYNLTKKLLILTKFSNMTKLVTLTKSRLELVESALGHMYIGPDSQLSCKTYGILN